MSYEVLYKIEKEINESHEKSMKAMLSGDLYAYKMMRDSLNSAEEKRKGVEDVRRIQDLSELENTPRTT